MLFVSHQQQVMSNMDLKHDHAFGCLIGLAIGDAIGAPLEFARQDNKYPKKVDNAMKLTGGGVLRIGPGQVTDDTELALALADALYTKHPRKHGFPTANVLDAYGAWYRSGPFDIGGTCRTAFGRSTEDIFLHLREVAQASSYSEANGALMRIAPLAIWACEENDHLLAHYATLDAMLSHPSIVCQQANVLYCLAIAHLIKHPQDNQGALQAAEQYAENFYKNSKVYEWLMHDARLSLTDSVKDKCHSNIGHVRWGFIMAFYHLRHATPFKTAMRETVELGGDTDTNAAIVGGLMGAFHGSAGIPIEMIQTVQSFQYDPDHEEDLGYDRPNVYHPSRIYQLSYALLKHNLVLR